MGGDERHLHDKLLVEFASMKIEEGTDLYQNTSIGQFDESSAGSGLFLGDVANMMATSSVHGDSIGIVGIFRFRHGESRG